MKILYFATLRLATKKSEEEWNRPAPTLRPLIQDLVSLYGTGFSQWVVKNGELAGLSIVLVDGVDVRSLQGLDTPLTSTSEIAIFPPLAGG